MEPAIRADDLRKSYGDVRALDGLTFDADRGEFFGLLGPNGAAKTTFINVLVGLVRKDGGTAEVFGYDVEDDYRAARDRIGLAPQEFNVDRFFPIHEVLEHKAGYHGVPADEAERRAESALKTVGIWDTRDTRFDWLSGGMKRRFLLARALVTEPDGVHGQRRPVRLPGLPGGRPAAVARRAERLALGVILLDVYLFRRGYGLID